MTRRRYAVAVPKPPNHISTDRISRFMDDDESLADQVVTKKGHDSVEQRGGRWVVLSQAGKPLGEYDTEVEARERLRQIEAAKAVRDDS